MARVLITGASGLLGSNLASDWADRHEVIGTYYHNSIAFDRVAMLQVDLTQPGAVRDLVERCRPDWIINCAAATDLDRCEQKPNWAEALNHHLAGEIGETAYRSNSRLVHISTDAVFDGRSGGYQETDPPNPLSIYGQSKLAGEQAVLAANRGTLVVRTNLFGWNKQPKLDLAEWFLANIETGKECPGFVDVCFSPVLVNHLGDLLLRLIVQDVSGLLHLGGRTCLSKFDFGKRLAEAVGADPTLVRPISVEDAGLLAPRAKNLCMNSGLAVSLIGQDVPSIDQGINSLLTLGRVRTRNRHAK